MLFQLGMHSLSNGETLGKMLEGRKQSLNTIAKVLNSLMIQLEIWEH